MQSLPIRILLVEDNPGDMRLIRHMLHSTPVLGIDLTSTERLDSALQRLATHAFDLVLLDLSLPDSQGLTTFETLYQQSPELPMRLNGNALPKRCMKPSCAIPRSLKIRTTASS